MKPVRRQLLGLALSMLTLLPPLAVRAATSIAGTVFDGAGGPWTLSGSPYIVTGDVTVPAAQTLTIQAGVVVKFVYGSTDLIVNGTLSADATAAAKIIFTADRDDTAGGDTNGDGNASSPYADIWGCLHFTTTSVGSVLDYVEVRYGGWAADGGVWIDGGQASVTNSVLRDIGGSGIRVMNSAPILTGNTYANNAWAAVSMDLASDPAISGSTVTNNRINGLALDSGTLVGNRVWDDTDVVHVFFGDITVPAGQTLTLAPGLIVKVEYGANDLIVNGTLLAEGTSGAPIRVTALRDDTIGGDTENNGATTPSVGIWGNIALNDTSTGSRMSHVEVRYGGWGGRGNILVDGGQLTLTDSTLKSAYGAGIRIQQSDVVLTNNTYQSNTGAAVSMDLDSDPDIHGVTVSGNGTNGLVLDGGTLARSLKWDDPDIVYTLFSDITVPAGAVLNIAANQVIKFGYGSVDLWVNGTLIAAGTAGAPVEFTAYTDDSAGGDTNSNAAADAPYRGYWGGLTFGTGSTGNVLQHCRLSYGGWSNSGELMIDHAEMTMSDCTVRQSSQNGMRIVAASPVLQNTAFEANSGSAVSMDLASNPDIDGVTLTNNGANGLTLDSGTLPGNGFWDDPDITYRMSGDVAVPAGSTLVVAPGQVVKAAYGSLDLIVSGTLSAQGTTNAPIVFTSDRDDTVGGDTNNNANGDGPYAGIWDGLRFEVGSTANVLDHVEVRYGGWSNPGSVWLKGGQLHMANSTVYRSAHHGLRLEDSDPILSDNRFELNTWSAIAMNLACNPDLQGVTLVSNGTNALSLDGGVLPGDAHWDDPDITYRMSGDVTVPPGLILTVGAGQVVKAAYAAQDLIVQGTLLAEGTAVAPIVFTSERDDSVGGDTNNNGNGDGPYPGIWGRLRFEPTATGNVLTHVSVLYPGWAAAGGIELDGADASLTDCTVFGASVYGIRLQNCAPVLTRTTLDSNAWAAISANLATVPVIVGVTLADNGQNGLRLDGGTLPGDAIWDDTDIVHILSEDVTVPTGSTLTLVPGLVVKVQYASIDLRVDGTLLAEGTVDAPIVITSDRDDTVGGDTNNSTAGPSRGIWGGLILRSGSLDSVLEYVDIRYGGWATDAELLLDGCSARLRNSIVTLSGSSGVGVRSNANIDIENTIVTENAYSGIFAVTGSVATVVNSTIDHNAGGVYTDAATASVTNCLITRNTSSGLHRAGTSALTVRYCDVYNPGSGYGDYRNLASQTGQNGNLSADPLYAGKGALAYGLQEGSPAIDAATSVGAPARDFLGRLRFDDPAVPNVEPGLRGHYDIGALEYGGLAPLDIDLVTGNVAGPAAGTQNGTVHVTWEVTNAGTDDAVGAWYDAVYLSADATLSADDRLIGNLQHTSGLAAGASYSAALDVLLQGVIPGSFHFLVLTDAREETREGGTQSNNAAPSPNTASFTMPQLSLGVVTAGTFATVGDLQYYQILVPTGSNLIITLDDGDNAGQNELYLSRGAPPSPTSAQYSAVGGADQGLAVPAAPAGAWYVLVHNASGTGTYTLLAEVTQLSVRDVSPAALGNSADMTLTVDGAGFVAGTQVRLVDGGGIPYSATVSVDSFARVTATFAAGSVPAGLYTVRVSLPSGTAVERPDAFTVLAGGEAGLDARVVVPNVLGYHQVATLYVEYTNTGTLAMQAPLLILTAEQKGRQAALLTLDARRVSNGFWTAAVPEGFSHSVFLLASGSTPGILQPGESGRLPVYWAGWLQPWDFSYPPFQFALYTIQDGGKQTIDWAAIKEPARPPEIDTAAWDVIFTAFAAGVGATYADYVQTLNANAAHLGRFGVVENDIGRLLGMELAKASGLSPVTILTSSVDAMVRGGGLPLVLERAYPQGIANRHRLGPFGRGWTHTWDKSQSLRADGSVVLTSSGTNAIFQPDTRGGFLAPQGYAATLRQQGADFVLTERVTGLVYRFSAGLLTSVTDADGNRVDLLYTAGRLTSLRNGASQTVTFSYNAQGRIAQVADAEGNSATYTYDGSGEFLSSVTDAQGLTTQYTYAGGGGAALYRALTGIAYPDGTTQTFSYDAAGRLAGTDLGEAGTASFVYDARGSVTMTNQNGGTGHFAFDADGRFLRSELPPSINTLYDQNGRLSSLTVADGARHDLQYDARGNLSRWTDPLGSVRSFAYDSLGGLSRATDPLGRVTRYTRNAAGNLQSITYPNGASESYGYDGAGNLTGHTNARGQTEYLSYTSTGKVAALVQPGGTTYSCSYTAQDNIAAVTGPNGTTSITYDTNRQITAIAYPEGKSLSYTYDTLGRRTSMTDHLGHVTRYAYDAMGRLAEIADGAGTPIAGFVYGPGNVLLRRELGNGARVEYGYDAWGRPLAVTNRDGNGAVQSSFSYAYDDLGQLATMQTTTGTWSYTYDALGRLSRAQFAPSGAEPARDLTYTYDACGNRVSMTVDGASTAYSSNVMDQYTTAGASALGYDADGNLTSMTNGADSWTYQYDAFNRLVAAQHGGDTWTYEYDAFGFRSAVSKNGVRSTFLYDPTGYGDLVGEFDASGALLRRHVHGAGVIATFDGAGNAYYPVSDVVGNVVALTDDAGVAVNTYTYAPFGENLSATETVGTPFRFVGDAGAVTDETGLVFMRNRYYSPQLGRFLSADPPRDSTDNRYAYADNCPTMLIDPLGTAPKSIETAFQHTPESVRRHIRELIEYERQHGTAAALYAFNPTWHGEKSGHFYRTAIQTNCGRVDMDWFFTLGHFCRTGRNVGVGGGAVVGGPFGALAGWALTSPTLVYWPAKIGWSFIDGENVWGHLKAIGNDEELVAIGMANMIHAGYSIESVFATYGIPTGSRDPNGKIGPQGYGASGWIPGDQTLAYRIDFENDSSAGAPAQYVAVRDPLSPSFDWRSFELTEIGFGDRLIAVPAGRQSYSTVVSMDYLGVDFEVQVQVGLNPATGLIQADLFTIDPETGLPPPVDVGFLPPEDGSGRGQGYFAYVIRPLAGLPSGTEIRNVATITFDFGEVIDTNQVDPHDPGAGTDPAKEALVTLDTAAPSSAVAALPALSLPGFLVSWSGTDAGAGIASYTIYVQDNGGPFTPWLTATTLTEEVYAGVAGHTYGFYSIATDAVGWQEAAKTVAESSTAMAYALVFEAGPHGSLTGATTQYVAAGASTTPVTAVPAEGYHFRRWTQGAAEYSLANPLTVDPVTADLALTAEFEINSYTLTYSAGPNGSVTGPTPQTVNHGADGATVTAVPHAGYHFVQWSDGILTAGRTDTHVTAALTVTASFAINQYTLTYGAGPHGSIVGPTPQTLDHGATAAAVTAVPAEGYHFRRWTQGAAEYSLANPLTVDPVIADLTLTAEFEIDSYTLTYSAGPNGSVTGPTPQTVNHGADGATVTAVPHAGYHFVQWSDGILTAARTDTHVTAALTVTASFAINQYTLTYSAGPHGSIVGPTPQTVDHGATAAAVTATPDAGFRFVQWSDGVLTAERTDTNVSADLTVTASFAVNQHTLSYSAGPHGSLAGNALQTVPHEGDGTALQALPDEGYVFTQWSDGSTANPRTDTRVIADLVVTAEFSVAGGVAPVGPFLARIGAAGVAAGQGLWDLTGPYATLLGNHELTLNLTHDRRGKLGGTAILRVNTAKGLVPVALPIKGSTRGSGGALLAALRLQGSDAARTVRVALAFDLALNPAARQLHGPVTGSLKVNGVPGAIPDSLTLDLPAGMDGTWTVLFDLEREGSRSLTGTALLTLANGVDYLCIAKGRIAGQGAVLTLSGHPADPPATAIRIRTTIETLEGGQARLRTLSGSVYGQTLGW